MKNNASLLYSIFLALGDFLALVTAFVAAYIYRVNFSDVPIANPVHAFDYLRIFLILLPFWILIFGLLGLYNSNIYERRFSEFGRLIIGSFIGLQFVIFYDFLTVEPIFPAKLVPIYGFGLAFLLLILFRNIARGFRTLLFGYNVGITNIMIVGNTAISDELLQSLHDSRRSGYRVLGVVGDARRVYHADYASFADALRAIPARLTLHAIFQTELYPAEEHNRQILDYAQEHHISYRFIPGNTELFVGNIDVELFRNGVPVIAVRQTPLFGWGKVVKRLFDLSFGGVLLVLASPFMLLTAIIIKLTDPRGPVFMRGVQQNRLTRFNRTFKVYKFRSHYAKYDGKTDEEVFAMVGKPELIEEYRRNGDRLQKDFRVTPFGRFIRRSSLDELPQLFNVLKGDISLVGPRALVAHELEQFDKKHTILSVKSGLTGLAVVSGRSNIPYEERRKLDMYYVQNWSFWLDLTILLKTVRVVLDRTGSR
jgi:exopolysaccharide biosynthesis polyprenyl glycosylphosphotransferase